MTPVSEPVALAVRVGAILDHIQVRYTIGGSIAASFAGEPRSTLDIDVVVALKHSHIEPLVAALGNEFYFSEDALHRAIDTAGTVNLIDQDTNIKVDLFIAGGTPLDEQQLERRRAVDVGEGKTIYIHPPEDILLQKLRWYRSGHGISDRQWRDIIAIVRTQGPLLDREYVRRNAPALSVEAEFDRALQEADA